MVRGLDIFTKYFENYSDNYVIIGGTACDILIEEAGFIPRATKDIDIILIVEALNTDFVKQFWQFVTEGNYERKEKSDDERKYYRFVKPENLDFPFQLELFARNPLRRWCTYDTHTSRR
jgi:phosphorylcholine metabolism protein LicD